MTSNAFPVRPGDIDLPAFLEELRTWVEIESPTSDATAVNRMADRIAAHATARGLSVSRHPTRPGTGDCLIVRQGDRHADGVVMLAHMDTVHPLGTLDAMPWTAEGDRIFGPGIYDMKCGALMAIEALALSGAPATIVFAPDEETGTTATRSMIEDAVRGARAVLVVEPAREGGKVVTGRRGSANYSIRVTGRAAHSGSRPQDGRSAIRAAARLVLRLEEMNDPDRRVGVNVGVIHGGTTRNTIPADCILDVGIRIPDPQAERELTAAVAALSPVDPDITLTVTGGVTRPAFAADAASRALFDRAAPIAEAMGYPLVGMVSGGGSDGNFAAALGVPVLDGLGPDGAEAHTRQEHLFASSIAPRLAMLANLLIELQR